MHPEPSLMPRPPAEGEFDQLHSIIVRQCELCDEAVSNLEARLGLILGEACPASRQANADISGTCTLTQRLAEHLEELVRVTCRIDSLTNSINI